MAERALAQETVLALRRTIARIEGTLPEKLSSAGEDTGTVLVRRHGRAEQGRLATGAAALDAALEGGLPEAALTEIHGVETREGGTVAGFTLALAGMVLARRPGPLLWVAAGNVFREAGLPYAPGLYEQFGLAPERLLLAEVPKLADALWLAEEAARLSTLAAVLVEIIGSPARLDLTATRRLHRRAILAGRPVFLLRQSALAEPTAAPVRLVVRPAPSGLKNTLAGPLERSIGPPGFAVTLHKSPTARTGHFTLEWNSHDRRFADRPDPKKLRAEVHGAVVPLPLDREAAAPASFPLLAQRPAAAAAAAGGEQPRPERPAHRRP
jgi:protein ImuA